MSASSPMPWIKLYTEILDDPKMGRLPKALKWQFVELCLLAGECDAEGYLVSGEHCMDLSDIAWRLRADQDELIADMDTLQNVGLIAQDGDGCWFVCNFAKRQGRPQHEKREAWRERKQRQREQPDDSWQETMPEDGTTDEPEEDTVSIDVSCHAGVTRESQEIHAPRGEERRGEKETEEEESRGEKRSKSRANARSGLFGDTSPPPNGLTEGQRYWLDSFGAKRFANSVQREAVLALERTYGTEVLAAGIQWAAKQGMGMGRALTSLETALPKWGKTKGKGDILTVRGL